MEIYRRKACEKGAILFLGNSLEGVRKFRRIG